MGMSTATAAITIDAELLRGRAYRRNDFLSS